MKFTIPHNWQADLIDGMPLDGISEFYGKLDVDVLGGGRPSNICPPVSKETVRREVREIHDRGIEFNYLLNSTCMDNQELSFSVQKKLTKLCDWLCDLPIDSVTVSMPYILGFVKKNYPQIKTNVSTMAQVDHPDKAVFWQDLGADKITLFEVKVNRDFELIKKISKTVTCDLQLIANNGCLFHCPFTVNHGVACSHASQEGDILHGFIVDFYRMLCCYMRLKEPVNYIRGDWIRPEDVHYYEDLGITHMKIVNRGMSSNVLKVIVNAYVKGEYKGNLMELLPSPSKNINFNKTDLLSSYKYFFRPRLINIFKLPGMKKIYREMDDIIYINNTGLNGFLGSLQNKNCGITSCKDCSWCKEIADKVISIDNRKADLLIKEIEGVLDEFISGKLFSYF